MKIFHIILGLGFFLIFCLSIITTIYVGKNLKGLRRMMDMRSKKKLIKKNNLKVN